MSRTLARLTLRLAAATLAAEEPALRGAARLDALAADPDPLVRSSARAALGTLEPRQCPASEVR